MFIDHNLITNGQAETRTFADVFSGEEWIKDARSDVFWDSDSVV